MLREAYPQMRIFSVPRLSELCLQFFYALCTYTLAVKVNDVVYIATENASRLILLKNDLVVIGKDLDSVLLLNIKNLSDLYGQHQSSQLINFAYNSGGLHKFLLCE